MPVEIVQESAADLEAYSSVPISFQVTSRFNVLTSDEDGGFALIEEPVEPYLKDYDLIHPPADWLRQFDVSNWAFFAAINEGVRVGGAVVAHRTPTLNMLGESDDVACLWDLRVLPGCRGIGAGTLLFDAAVAWSRDRGVHTFKVETQDINVPACRFYAKHGCELREVNRDAYPPEMNEIQLIWYLDL